jgi:hypothetical protein
MGTHSHVHKTSAEILQGIWMLERRSQGGTLVVKEVATGLRCVDACVILVVVGRGIVSGGDLRIVSIFGIRRV